MQCLSLVGIGWVGWSKCQFPAIVKVPVRIAHYESPLSRCIVRCKVSAYLCLGRGQGLGLVEILGLGLGSGLVEFLVSFMKHLLKSCTVHLGCEARLTSGFC